MTICISGHNFACELGRLCRLYYPYEKIRYIEPDEEPERLHALVSLTETDGGGEVLAKLTCDGAVSERRIELNQVQMKDKEQRDLALADGLYALLCELTGYEQPWGMLTGVRPVKLLRMLREQRGEAAARSSFIDAFHCSEEKYDLCCDTELAERRIIERSSPQSFSLYISIPFCPTRCSYCSFVSQSVEKTAKLVPEYVELLKQDIIGTAQVAKRLGLRLDTVYMGGGTPTTLSAQQLAEILDTVNSSFDLTNLMEYTVEAGRPDTVTPEKLSAIKSAGVDRISINPQTMSDNILETIGRRHTAGQVFEAMAMARSAGFDNINMDLIAGLPGDTAEGFMRTLDSVFSMKPENITVHTLSMKRASTLVTEYAYRPDNAGLTVAKMLGMCARLLLERGYHPYYLYRQTRMLGNLENVGWAMDARDGLYNVYIMDETHTILAVGAGGVTKLRQPGVNNIERIYNYKFPYEYIGRFDELMKRKHGVEEFYEKFG